jgi:hypothetical protein
MIGAIHDVARRRFARIRSEVDGESGFAMIFVLGITMLITVGVSSALVITASNVIPAKHNQDNVAALAAAQAGLEDYVAFLNASCVTFDSLACTSINGTATPGTVEGTDNVGTETYVRQVLNPTSYLTDGFLRVRSIGKAGTGKKTLIADLAGLPSVLRFAYLSKYETLASTFVNAYYPARTIAITNSASATAADRASPALAANGSVTWAAPSGTDMCDKLWYDDSTNATDTAEANPAGADADPAYQNPGRDTVKANYRTTLSVGSDWTQTSSGAGTTLNQPCEVTFTSGMTFTGPVYSKDALYLSYGTTGGTGPNFNIPDEETLPPVSTGWSSASFPAAFPGQIYRPFPYILGAPSATSTFADTNTTVETSAYDLQLPTDVVDAAGTAACVYTGPTRIVVTGATATIISPLTTASASSPCYANTNAGVSSSISPTGVTSARVPVGSTIIYVQNKGTGATSTKGSSANPIFSLSTPDSSTTAVNGTPTVTATDNGFTPNTVTYLLSTPPISDGGWTLQWPSYSLLSALNLLDPTCTGLIGSLTAAADLAFFNCNLAHPSSPDAYSYVKTAVKAALAANPSAYTTPSALATLVKNVVAVAANGTLVGNTADWNNATPDYANNKSHRYVVSAVADTGTTDGCTPGTTTTTGSPTTVARPTSDKFLSTAAQGYVYPTTQSTATCMTATVKLQIGTKNSNYNSNDNSCHPNNGNCGWGDGTNNHVGDNYFLPQFKVTTKVVTPATSAHTTSTTVAFPDGQDATQYATWDSTQTNAPGDLYVEGTGITSKLSLVAQHDIAITGPLTSTTTTGPNALGENAWVSGGAVSLVAKNNARIYHPVKCAVSSSSTTAGYCANDITGLYSGNLGTNGVLTATHPAMQYCNLTPDSTGNAVNTANTNCTGITATGTGLVANIDAAVFALNGSLMADNYNRGVSLGTSAVLGGIYQLHRGGTGQEWEALQTDTGRASSGYRLQNTYLALDAAGLPYVPALKSGNSSRAWNIVSVSAG